MIGDGRRAKRVAAFSVEEFEAHHLRPAGQREEAVDAQAAQAEAAEAETVATETVAAEAAEAVILEPPTVLDPGAVGIDDLEAADDTPEPPGGGDEEDSPRAVIHLDDPAEMLPALAGVAADLGMRAAIWSIETTLRTSARLARAAVNPEAAAELYQDVSGGIRAYAREFLGISEMDAQLRQLTPLAGATLPQNGESPESTLREQGARLLRQAADVSLQDGVHPAFARILTELAPDEARILRTLTVDGPQPLVDIREANLIGMGSQLIASGLNMIGTQAGLRFRDRSEAYLGNLHRLGLIALSDDAVEDAIAYQVLEAQPDVLGTIKETPRAKSVHRSIRLTPFGQAFCRVCLPLEQEAAAGDRLSGTAQDETQRP